jgi:hypothetical protein
VEIVFETTRSRTPPGSSSVGCASRSWCTSCARWCTKTCDEWRNCSASPTLSPTLHGTCEALRSLSSTRWRTGSRRRLTHPPAAVTSRSARKDGRWRKRERRPVGSPIVKGGTTGTCRRLRCLTASGRSSPSRSPPSSPACVPTGSRLAWRRGTCWTETRCWSTWTPVAADWPTCDQIRGSA